MAIGDYVKTEYINNSTPAINSTNLNKNEDKTKELDEELEKQQLNEIYGLRW